MPAIKTITVSLKQGGQRLDIFLAKKLKTSRSQAQKLIAERRITVNGTPPKKAGDTVRAGSVIVIARSVTATKSRDAIKGQSPARQNNVSSEKNGIAAAAMPKASGLAMTVRVIAATPDYIIVNKPTGILTHPTPPPTGTTTRTGHGQARRPVPTLATFLLKKYPEIKNVGDSPRNKSSILNLQSSIFRPGIVHRLDKEASGLLVVARTQKMFNHLKEQFKNRTVAKEYLALAHGRVAKDWDEINFPIARSQTLDRMAARPLRQPDLSLTLSSAEARERHPPSTAVEGAGGGFAVIGDNDTGEKQARTEFTVEKRFVNFTLLRVTLHTGRMHQIRVHLLAYNHPLLGDPLYNQTKRKSKWDSRLGRLFLHSTKLSFNDLNGERQTFESPLPQQLAEFLRLLR